MSLFGKKRKVALALGGGAARGLANLGVLKVLEKERVPIDLIIGSSIGGLIGAAYCLGTPLVRLEKEALKLTWKRLVDMTIPGIAIIKGEKLAGIIEDITDKKTFEDTRIPLAITTTDIETGDELVHTSGNLQKIIRASCSWPGIFTPVRLGGRLLGDGGIRNSIPAKWSKKLGATFTIAVNIGFVVKNGGLKNIFQMWVQAVQIMGVELDRYQSMQADVIIEPKMNDIDQLAFDRAKDAIKEGEAAAKKSMPRIKKLLNLR